MSIKMTSMHYLKWARMLPEVSEEFQLVEIQLEFFPYFFLFTIMLKS